MPDTLQKECREQLVGEKKRKLVVVFIRVSGDVLRVCGRHRSNSRSSRLASYRELVFLKAE